MVERIFIDRPMDGVMFRTTPGVLRFSTAVRRLRESGEETGALEVEALKERVGSLCPIHGELIDPIMGILGKEIAFCCPQCSSPELFKAWQEEGEHDGN